MNRLATIIVALCALSNTLLAQSDTEFTYQGTLNDAGAPADGVYFMTFALYDALSGGSQTGRTLASASQPVIGGNFTSPLDFGAGVFDNSARWLEITVNGDTLAPRQVVSRSPYSIQTRGIFVDDINNVGIGTTSPEATLHVAGPIMSAGPGGGDLSARNPNNQTAAIGLGWANDVPRLRIGGEGLGTDGGFDIQTVGNRSLLRVLDNGNVGIGTTVLGSHRLTLKEASSTNSQGLRILNADESRSFQAWVGTGGVVLDAEGPANLHLQTGSVDRLFIENTTGNVAIGNVSPAHRLDVVSSGSAAAVRIKGGPDATPIGGGQLVLGDQSTRNVVLDSDEISARFNGSPTRLRVNPNGGSIEFGPQAIRPAFAYGRIAADGTIRSASPNVRNLLARAPNSAYRILMTDGNQLQDSDIVLVTAIGSVSWGFTGTEVLINTGRLEVRVKAAAGNSLNNGLSSFNTVDSDFCFVVYRP